MRLVKGILIDPFACTVIEVEHDADDYKNIHRLISHETKTVDIFTCAYSDLLQPGEAVFVDDEGLLTPCDRFFMLNGHPTQPLAGKGLLLGSNGNGDTISASTSLECIKEQVMFLGRDAGRLVRVAIPWQPKRIPEHQQ